MILVSFIEKGIQTVILEGEKAALIKRTINCNSSTGPGLVCSVYDIVVPDISFSLASCLRR